MEIVLPPAALENLEYWQKSNNSSILKRTRQLLSAIQDNLFTGAGKPEQLKYDFSGWWSHRIDREHRLVYSFENETIFAYSLWFYY